MPAQQVGLDDLLEYLRGAALIPGAFGIHDGHRAAGADLEAIHLGPGNQRLRADESQFLEAVFQEVPGGLAGIGVAALRLRGRRTKEEVPDNGGNTVADGNISGRFRRDRFGHGENLAEAGIRQSGKGLGRVGSLKIQVLKRDVLVALPKPFPWR